VRNVGFAVRTACYISGFLVREYKIETANSLLHRPTKVAEVQTVGAVYTSTICLQRAGRDSVYRYYSEDLCTAQDDDRSRRGLL